MLKMAYKGHFLYLVAFKLNNESSPILIQCNLQ